MENYISQEHALLTWNGMDITATCYIPSRITKPTVIYFHGGGFVLGDKKDLPEQYIKLFLDQGYPILACNYPLAPEVKLSSILSCTADTLEFLLFNGLKQLHLPTDYILFGRSAGGFICLHLASRASRPPFAILCLYGYYRLTDAAFSTPSRHYLSYAKCKESLMRSHLSRNPITSGSMQDRYPIYLYGRQTGRWIDLLLDSPQEATVFSLSTTQLSALPPTYLCCADQDPDIPLRQSKMMDRYIPNSKLQILSSSIHDFDRVEIEQNGLPVYQDMLCWLDDIGHTIFPILDKGQTPF